MSYKIQNLNVTNESNYNRQYYHTLNDVYIKQLDTNEYIEVFHNSKKVVAGIDNSVQLEANPSKVYDSTITKNNIIEDEYIDDTVFLFFDQAGQNYIHFFFNMFCKCFYYDELIKTNPNLKFGILESFYQDSGNYSFIKDWLNLYYKDLNVIVFKKDTQYKIKELILPNGFYAFPEGNGYNSILQKIVETASKIEPIQTKSDSVYISRQDTIKRGWYHNRILTNELELIDKLKSELNYDIVELMDYDIIGKIRIFKSYKYILQQSSASNMNILFSGEDNTNIILAHPLMEGWLGYHSANFAKASLSNLIMLSDGGTLLPELKDLTVTDPNNCPWELSNIDGIIEVLKNQI
jgi:hypothetical protein